MSAEEDQSTDIKDSEQTPENTQVDQVDINNSEYQTQENAQIDQRNQEDIATEQTEEIIQTDEGNQENAEVAEEVQEIVQNDEENQEDLNNTVEQSQENIQTYQENQQDLVNDFVDGNELNESNVETTSCNFDEETMENASVNNVQIETESLQVNDGNVENSSEEIQTEGDSEAQNLVAVNENPNSELDNNNNNANVLIVNIYEGDEQKTIQVEIIDGTYKKPFLGGFRHRKTGVEYLNASCQTLPKNLFPSMVEKFSRDTQTVKTKSYAQQTFNSTSTQMTKPGCYISDATDVIRIPGKYVTAEEKERAKLERVIMLQSYCRRWLSTQYVKKVRRDRDLRIQWEQAQAEQKAAERAERLRQEFERRMKPKSKADFDLLYAALERWRKEELDRINATSSGDERKAALISLLEQETFMIQSIERHKINADQINQVEHIRRTLEKAALPIFWRAYDGKLTEMNTQHTLRAQELKDLYNSLQMNYLTNDERLDVLLSLKHTVKEHDCKLTQELIELIDREAALLGRSVKNSNLEGLRQRISTLFLQYCKTPLFNPEIGRLLKVPQDPSKLQKDIYFCPSCNSYLPSTEFPLASNSRIVGRCKKCANLDNNARLRHDFTKIRFILQHLRRTEEAFNDNSKIAFIIQDADLRYLIENIWNAQSAISGIDDLYELVLIRWKNHEQWSPWNCVLLTKEEASAHMKLENVTEAYGRIFIGKVRHKHVLAKQYFSKLTKVTSNQKPVIGERSKTNNRVAAAVS